MIIMTSATDMYELKTRALLITGTKYGLYFNMPLKSRCILNMVAERAASSLKQLFYAFL